jgi:catechol 2,3-dioxygenase
VHSVDQIVISVPELEPAVAFFTAFGLDVRRHGQELTLHTHGNPHAWMRVVANGQPKRLQYLRLGIYPEDESAFRERIAQGGTACAPSPLGSSEGLWLQSPDGTPLQLVVADKVSPSAPTTAGPDRGLARDPAAAPTRSQATNVRPRGLSHVLVFTPDVSRLVDFCNAQLGLRLSDRSGDGICFMHGIHGSDHHLVAFAKSAAPGLHHCSWDVGSVNEIGKGAMQMAEKGYQKGWGLGRHVLGSNYFHYVRDPWDSYSEYSADIDYIPATCDWDAGDYPPEDSIYLWGPELPKDFIVNHEAV